MFEVACELTFELTISLTGVQLQSTNKDFMFLDESSGVTAAKTARTTILESPSRKLKVRQDIFRYFFNCHDLNNFKLIVHAFIYFRFNYFWLTKSLHCFSCLTVLHQFIALSELFWQLRETRKNKTVTLPFNLQTNVKFISTHNFFCNLVCI